MSNDRRESAVYVSIEDRTYIGPPVETGRSVFGVILTDRGEDMKVIQTKSRDEYRMKFGRPNIDKCSQTHYCLDKCFEYTSDIYSVRVTPEDACFAHSYMTENDGDPVEVDCDSSSIRVFIDADQDASIGGVIGDGTTKKFKFTEGSAEVLCSDWAWLTTAYPTGGGFTAEPVDGVMPYYIFPVLSEDCATDVEQALPVLGITEITSGHSYGADYDNGAIITLGAPFAFDTADLSDASCIDQTDSSFEGRSHRLNVKQIVCDEAFRFIPFNTPNTVFTRINPVPFWENDYDPTIGPWYRELPLNGDYGIYSDDDLNHPSRFVEVVDKIVIDGYIELGDWIYADCDSPSNARQVIDIIEYNDGRVVLKLDDKYHSNAHCITNFADENNQLFTSKILKKQPFIFKNVESGDPDIQDCFQSSTQEIEGNNFVYLFRGIGRGSYYNNLRIIGRPNYEMEKLYTDNDGKPLYRYIFMDVMIQAKDTFNNWNTVEGPWTVSLIRETPDGEIIRDFFGGAYFFIEDVINHRSNLLRMRIGSAIDYLSYGDRSLGENQDRAARLRFSETKRLQTMLMFMSPSIVGFRNIGHGTQREYGVSLSGGFDGDNYYDVMGRLNMSNLSLMGRVAQAYEGSLTSEDGSIEVLPESIYPKYTPDYIISGGFPVNVGYAARGLASGREDLIHLSDTGLNYTNWSDDINARQSAVSWNDWTSALYIQYREIFDNNSARYFWMTPVYHAIQRHLDVDNKYFIAEPVANIEKGAIGESIKLAYPTNHSIRGDLWDKELNYTLDEPDGVYFNCQFTTWKRMSALKRLHIAKFTAYLKKQFPKLLKDVIQRKATTYWLTNAQQRCDIFMSKFLDNSTIDRYACIETYSVNLQFDKQRSELNIFVSFIPILAIERINVFITLESAG